MNRWTKNEISKKRLAFFARQSDRKSGTKKLLTEPEGRQEHPGEDAGEVFDPLSEMRQDG